MSGKRLKFPLHPFLHPLATRRLLASGNTLPPALVYVSPMLAQSHAALAASFLPPPLHGPFIEFLGSSQNNLFVPLTLLASPPPFPLSFPTPSLPSFLPGLTPSWSIVPMLLLGAQFSCPCPTRTSQLPSVSPPPRPRPRLAIEKAQLRASIHLSHYFHVLP